MITIDTKSSVMSICAELQSVLSGSDGKKPFVSLSIDDDYHRIVFRPPESAGSQFQNMYAHHYINSSSSPAEAEEFISKYPEIFPVNVDLSKLSSKQNNTFSYRKVDRTYVRDPVMGMVTQFKESRKLKLNGISKAKFKKPVEFIPLKGRFPVNMDVPLKDIIDAEKLQINATYFPPFPKDLSEFIQEHGKPLPLIPHQLSRSFTFSPIPANGPDEYQGQRPVTLSYVVNTGLPIDSQNMREEDHTMLYATYACFAGILVLNTLMGSSPEEKAAHKAKLAERRRTNQIQDELQVSGDAWYDIAMNTIYNSTGFDISPGNYISARREQIQKHNDEQVKFAADAEAFKRQQEENEKNQFRK
jgi:hypothetical protein